VTQTQTREMGSAGHYVESIRSLEQCYPFSYNKDTFVVNNHKQSDISNLIWRCADTCWALQNTAAMCLTDTKEKRHLHPDMYDPDQRRVQ